MTSLRRRMTEDMQVRNLSLQTQATYVQQVSLFTRHFNQSPAILRPRNSLKTPIVKLYFESESEAQCLLYA